MRTNKRIRRRGLPGRGLAVLLLLLLCLELLPAGVKAAEGDTNLNWKTLESPGAVSPGTAVTNTYIFEISSGTRYGGGVTDNVLFFSLDYTTEAGLSRSVILIPGENEMGRGFDAAAAVGNREARRQEVKTAFGVDTKPLRDKPTLGSVQTDQLLFTTPEKITSIDKIQVYGRKTAAASDWACQGMRVYRVDTLYGLEMYGWYSDTGYIDFAGEVIARVNMSDPGGIVFKWDNTAGVHELTARTPGAALDNSVRIPHKSQAASRVVFRLDLADVAGAGFESLAGFFSAGSHTKAGDLHLCECAALTVRYRDVYGCVREIALPLVINALGQAVETLNDPEIAEFAQQGDSIAIPAMLPDLADVESVSITMGLKKAAEEAGLITSAVNTIQAKRLEKVQTDELSYICFAVYRDVEAQVALDGATLRTRFAAGPENPILFSTATASDGIRMAADAKTAFTLQRYYDKMVLSPVDRVEKYLITVSTDNVANAGTMGDIVLQFHYLSMKDKELESAEYNVRDYVRQFYGEWAGSVEDFAYRYGFRDGGTVQFIVPLQGVKAFKDVSIRVKGNDEWQFTGLNIAMVKSCSARIADWREISEGGLRSHLQYTREVETEAVAFNTGTVYEPEEVRPQPTEEGSGWTPGSLVQDDNAAHIFDGESREVTVKDDVDWSRLRHYMTFADAQQDLGFTKERFVYKVTVQVAGKTVNEGNDDCGSKNLFYFRLVFENGYSGFTLANQQVQGDAFRTGAAVQFSIPVTQDYGEVTAIQVIPDSQDGNSDIYDKLQIEYISVTRASEGSISPTWTARDNGTDGLGWVGIDYRDPGEMGTNSGARGRTLSELATTYQITETSYSANLLVSITTGAYDGQQQFSGGLSMSMNYFNTEGRLRPVDGYDAVAAMNAYAGRAGSRQRTYTVGNNTVTENVDFEVSNPAYQFRPGTTDSFLVTLEDVYQLADMSLAVRSNVVTDWSITAVNVYQVNGTGIRYINANGAYDYRYPEGQGLTRVASWTLDSVKQRLGVYRNEQGDSIAVIRFALDSNPIVLSKEAQSWSTKVLPVPASHNDTLNLMLYPSTANGAADPDKYDITAAVQYTNVNTRQPMQVSAGTMRRGRDGDGNTVFYALGLGAEDMDSLDGVTWSTDLMRTAQPAIEYGVIQRLRGGVLVESYRLTGVGGSLYADTAPAGARRTQRVQLQVGSAVSPQTLRARENDLAVAVYFRGASPLDQEYRSRYIYLTDQGYTEIHPGQLLDLEFELGDITAITGMNLVTVGNLEMSLTNALVTDLAETGTAQGKWSIQGIINPTRQPARFDPVGNVELLTLRLSTARDETMAGSGTEGPVRLTVGYYDIYGRLLEYTLQDARPYLSSGDGFTAGGTDELRLLMPEFGELRWIELEPLSERGTEPEAEGGESLASWKLDSLTAAVGVNGRGVTKAIGQRIMEHEPLRIMLADVIVIGTAKVKSGEVPEQGLDPVQEESLTVYSGNTGSLTLDSGDTLELTSRVSGSGEGVKTTLTRLDPVTGEEGSQGILDTTHGYDREQLEQMKAEAEASAADSNSSPEERTAAQAVLKAIAALRDSGGAYRGSGQDNGILFTPPRNYTGSVQTYRLKAYAVEAPESFLTLEISVRPEANELPDRLREWEAVRAAGKLWLADRDSETGETVTVMRGASLQQLISSGGTLLVTPRNGTLAVSVRSLDPATGATGQARLDPTHGYPQEVLEQLKDAAQSVLNGADSTGEEKAAAQSVLDQIEAMGRSGGRLEQAGSGLRFTAPRNFTGGNLYYRVTVYDPQSGETEFEADVSVQPESNPLAAAVSRLEAARNSAGLDRQSDAISEAIRAAGSGASAGGGTGMENTGTESSAPGGPEAGDGEGNG